MHLTDAELAELDPALRHALATCRRRPRVGREDFPLGDLAGRSPRSSVSSSTDEGSSASAGSTGSLLPVGDGDALLGHRHPPRAPVGAEQARPRPRRRHRPGQGHRRPDRPGQRARRHRPAVPLRRLRPGRPDVPHQRHRGRSVRRCRTRSGSTTAWCANGPTSPPRSTTSTPTTSGASRPRAASPTTRSRSSPSGTAACSSGASRRTSGRRSDTPRRPASRTCRPRRSGAVETMAADPDNHVLMELRPGDIQFINNFHVLHGRTEYARRSCVRPDPPPEAPVARDQGPDLTAPVLHEREQPLGAAPLRQPDAGRSRLTNVSGTDS